MKQNAVSAKDAHKSLDKAAVCGIVENSAHIAWDVNGDWAFGCDFWENDLDDVKSNISECKSRCAFTAGTDITSNHSYIDDSKYTSYFYSQAALITHGLITKVELVG